MFSIFQAKRAYRRFNSAKNGRPVWLDIFEVESVEQDAASQEAVVLIVMRSGREHRVGGDADGVIKEMVEASEGVQK